MMWATLLAVVLTAVQAGAQTPADRESPAAELAAARALYAAASYEEALERLARVGSAPTLQDQVDTYRALCLLALGRTRESEQAVESLLLRNPRYALDERDVSPRLVIVYRAVRARLLPTAARTLYATARASFDAGQFGVAVTQFREVLDLLDADAAADSSIGDLRVLAEGFLRQAEARRAGAAGASAQNRGGFEDASGGPVYSVLDRDVIGAVEVSRPVPVMQTPRGSRAGVYQGLVEVVIDERGRVESAEMRKSISPAFDLEILAAAREWRFEPATRNGRSVKYRRSYEIIGHTR